MKFTIKVLESDRTISQKIGNALIPEARKYMSKTTSKIKQGLPQIIYKAITDSPEYASILGGSLRYEFGIPDPFTKLDGLLDIWTKDISITYTPPSVIYNGSVVSSLSASMIRSDFSDVLGTEYALVVDRLRGYTLPWLSWLLLDGSAPVVNGHRVILGSNPRSRTGLAIMKKGGSNWGVPKRFAGTRNDNWITRAIDLSQQDIHKFIQRAMKYE